MRSIGLFEAKQKLSELVDRASRGERIGITRRGKLTALIVPAQERPKLKEVFEEIEQIRKEITRSSKHRLSAKQLIEEGRM
jgi:prevent-host-death family protein